MSRSDDGESVSHDVAHLTELERKILSGIANGESITSLASLLSLPQNSVAQAKAALMEKLAAKTTADVVRIGLTARVDWP